MAPSSLRPKMPRCLSDCSTRPSSACFVSFERTIYTERVIAVLGEDCEGPKFHQRPGTEQRKRAIEFFRDRAVLMAWDNYESVLPQFGTYGVPPEG